MDLFKNLDGTPDSSLYQGIGLFLVRCLPNTNVLCPLLDSKTKFASLGTAFLVRCL